MRSFSVSARRVLTYFDITLSYASLITFDACRCPDYAVDGITVIVLTKQIYGRMCINWHLIDLLVLLVTEVYSSATFWLLTEISFDPFIYSGFVSFTKWRTTFSLFLAVTKQLYETVSPAAVRPAVRPSITLFHNAVHAEVKVRGRKSRSQMSKQLWLVDGYEMMQKAWSDVKKGVLLFFKAGKFTIFTFNWAFPGCDSSFKSRMAMTLCTKLEVAVILRSHSANFKVARAEKSSILTRIEGFRTFNLSLNLQTVTKYWTGGGRGALMFF